MSNTIEFEVQGRRALFTDLMSKLSGEKCSYPVPTVEAMKGITRDIYWKPSIIWIIDRIRVMNRIRQVSEGTLVPDFHNMSKGDRYYYTYLTDVKYQVQAHFEFNKYRTRYFDDHDYGKHINMAERSLQRGGRLPVRLGTTECDGRIEPCSFGTGIGYYDDKEEMPLGYMFHSYQYPNETGKSGKYARFWSAKMVDGILDFTDPNLVLKSRFVCDMPYRADE